MALTPGTLRLLSETARGQQEPLPIDEAARVVVQMKNQGLAIHDMTLGRPTHDVPKEIREALAACAEKDGMGYTPTNGRDEFRAKVADYANAIYSLEDRPAQFDKDQIAMIEGGTQGFDLLMQLTLNKGDKVLSIVPTYPSYRAPAEMYGGSIELLHPERGFVPTGDEIRAAFAANERADGTQAIMLVMLNYPNNPSGAVLTPEQAKDIAGALEDMRVKYQDQERSFLVALDDVYVQLCKGPNVSIYQYMTDELRQDTAMILSGSKLMGMPGARGGALVMENKELAQFMERLVEPSINNQSVMGQAMFAAGSELMTKQPEVAAAIAGDYAGKVDYVCDRLDAISEGRGGEKSVPFRPEGAFYTIADLSVMKGGTVPEQLRDFVGSDTIQNDEHVVRMLLATSKIPQANGAPGEGVAVVAGRHFGYDEGDCKVRFTCAGKQQMLEKAMDAVERAVDMVLEREQAQEAGKGAHVAALTSGKRAVANDDVQDIAVVVTKESRAGEKRVSATPDTIGELVEFAKSKGKNIHVFVEAGAGEGINIPDTDYAAKGAVIVPVSMPGGVDVKQRLEVLYGSAAEKADEVIVLGVKRADRGREQMEAEVFEKLSAEGVNIRRTGFLDPLDATTPHVDEWKKAGITTFTMDQLPVGPNDPMNVLSPMSKIAGRLSVEDALSKFNGAEPAQNALILGLGSAGIAAAETAAAKGMNVTIAISDEKYRDKALAAGATEVVVISGDEAAQRAALKPYADEADIVIATARRNGEKAPLLIDEEGLKTMKKGAVAVDLALTEGGNIAGSRNDDTVTTENGVTITNKTGYPKLDPAAASRAYGAGLEKFAEHLIEKGVQLTDPLVRGSVVTFEGQKNPAMFPDEPPMKASFANRPRGDIQAGGVA